MFQYFIFIPFNVTFDDKCSKECVRHEESVDIAVHIPDQIYNRQFFLDSFRQF
jgi:hypothetical protein